MAIGADGQGRAGPEKFETLEADAVILALGQETDTALPAGVDGVGVRR